MDGRIQLVIPQSYLLLTPNISLFFSFSNSMIYIMNSSLLLAFFIIYWYPLKTDYKPV